MRLYTIGHGTVELAAFVRRLNEAGVTRIADVRRFPGSRRNPQFGSETLAAELPANGIAYEAFPDLGGRRAPLPDSPNAGLRNAGFRGYADWMATEAFASAYRQLLQRCADRPTAIMCAETPWWKCHRRLISDAAVLLDGIEVNHIIGDRLTPHIITPGATVMAGQLEYPLSPSLLSPEGS